MPKYNNIQRYKNSLEKQFNFSFSQPKNKQMSFSKNEELQPFEKRSLGMWINTILELHSEQFLHAFKFCRKVSLYYLNQYLLTHYRHLKHVIRAYIIASLLDYDFFIGINCEEKEPIEKECIFLNIMIQELTNKFFRQSQWLHKISHIPVFKIFSRFDPFLKGFTTIRQLKKITSEELIEIQSNRKQPTQKQRKLHKLQRLLQKKLSNNLEGKDLRIYQENFEELMLRVNIIVFEDVKVSRKFQDGSKIFHLIEKIIRNEDEKSTIKKDKYLSEELKRSIKQEGQLEAMKQDFKIKQMSEMMSQKQYSSQLHPQTERKEWKQTFQKEFLSTPPIPGQIQSIKRQIASGSPLQYPFTETKHNLPPKLSQNPITSTYKSQQTETKYNLPSQRYTEIPRLHTFEPVEEKKKQNSSYLRNNHINESVFHKIPSIEEKKKNKQKREQILHELEAIKSQKRKAHLKYLQYI